MALIPVIVCGGAGARLLSVSRSAHPKPFMQLPDGSNLTRKTYTREWRRSKGAAFDARLHSVVEAALLLANPERVWGLGAGLGELPWFCCEQGAEVASIDYSADARVLVSQALTEARPEENDTLYALIGERPSNINGSLVVHAAPNSWGLRISTSHRAEKGCKAGFWLPRIRHIWYEGLTHIKEQNSGKLKSQLEKHFFHVVL